MEEEETQHNRKHDMWREHPSQYVKHASSYSKTQLYLQWYLFELGQKPLHSQHNPIYMHNKSKKDFKLEYAIIHLEINLLQCSFST